MSGAVPFVAVMVIDRWLSKVPPGPVTSPIVVTPNTVLYRLGCHNPTRYVATNGAFASSSIVNGDITAPFNGADPVGLGTFYQGTFSINASPTYPQQLGASANYFVDCVFVPA